MKLAYANFIRNVAVQLVIEKGRLAFRALTPVPLLPKNKKINKHIHIQNKKTNTYTNSDSKWRPVVKI